jgi:3-hydroxyisobutyrate dehydrogenase-like beta-hydroxyacid dehydrogenase
MQIGVIGVGRMGGIVARRLMRAGHAVIGYDAPPRRSLRSRIYERRIASKAS